MFPSEVVTFHRVTAACRIILFNDSLIAVNMNPSCLSKIKLTFGLTERSIVYPVVHLGLN